MNFEDRRLKEFEGLDTNGHLNNALIGLVPQSSIDEMLDWVQLHRQSPRDYGAKTISLEKDFKHSVATLVGANHANSIALVQNTSSAISIIAHGLMENARKKNQGGNIVVFDDEYPSNREVWQALARRYGLEARMVSADPIAEPCREAHIEQACDKDTIALSLSAVQYSNGYAHDLGRIGDFCRKKDIFFMVDAIQACGVKPVDVANCHINALACGGHKWLMAPEGVGFMYTDDACRELIEPILYGWRCLKYSTTGQAVDDSLREDAQKYESGTQPNYLLAALNQSIRIINELGVGGIEHYLWTLKSEFLDEIQDLPRVQTALPFANEFQSGIHSPILSLAIDDCNVDELVRLLANNFQISTMKREGKLRVSPHIYNDRSEMNRLAKGLREFCS